MQLGACYTEGQRQYIDKRTKPLQMQFISNFSRRAGAKMVGGEGTGIEGTRREAEGWHWSALSIGICSHDDEYFVLEELFQPSRYFFRSGCPSPATHWKVFCICHPWPELSPLICCHCCTYCWLLLAGKPTWPVNGELPPESPGVAEVAAQRQCLGFWPSLQSTAICSSVAKQYPDSEGRFNTKSTNKSIYCSKLLRGPIW